MELKYQATYRAKGLKAYSVGEIQGLSPALELVEPRLRLCFLPRLLVLFGLRLRLCLRLGLGFGLLCAEADVDERHR